MVLGRRSCERNVGFTSTIENKQSGEELGGNTEGIKLGLTIVWHLSLLPVIHDLPDVEL